MDNNCKFEEAFIIKIPIRSEKKDVVKFLKTLSSIIYDDQFDIDKNLILIIKQKPGEKEKYSTPNTLLDLEYDSGDLVNTLKDLSLQEYSETLFDDKDDNPPLLFVFGKDIYGKTIYIKVKIRELKKKVLCLSFHYAEYSMIFPYR